jgi:hypothetical protein
MRNVSTGTGLVALSAAILGSTALIRFGPAEGTAHAGIAAAAISAAVVAQTPTEPTIVWYGTSASGAYGFMRVVRAWSDGRIEAKSFDVNGACPVPICNGTWSVISDPAQGLTYRSDINFDEKVDGADLGQLLADWGDAPRQDIPPSDCPLALINP